MVIALIARFRPSIRWDLNNPQYCRLDLFFHCFRLGKKKEESFEKGFAFCAQRRESIPLCLQCCRNPVSPPAKIFNHDCYYYARAIFSELARCIGEQKKKSWYINLPFSAIDAIEIGTNIETSSSMVRERSNASCPLTCLSSRVRRYENILPVCVCLFFNFDLYAFLCSGFTLTRGCDRQLGKRRWNVKWPNRLRLEIVHERTELESTENKSLF